MDKIEEFTFKQVIDNQERVIKEQKEDIERLQTQLNKEIHYNRVMKRALEKYADKTNWRLVDETPKYNEVWIFTDCEPKEVGFEPAQQVLKQVDNEE